MKPIIDSNMIQLKFPPIHKLIDKDLSSYEEDDPRRGVIVLEDHAIVVNRRSVVCFDLHDYFTIKEKKQTADEIESLNVVLSFMNHKLFGAAFWDELTKNSIVSIKDSKMHLEGAVKKDLIHDYKEFSTESITEILGKNINAEPINLSKITFYCNPMIALFSTFKTLLKNDSMAIEFTGVNTTLRFAFEDNPWLFGVIHSDGTFFNQQFVFQDFSSFVVSITK